MSVHDKRYTDQVDGIVKNEVLLKYLERTSVLALPRVFSQFSPHTINRHLWMIVFAVGILGTSLHLLFIIKAYVAYEVSMAVIVYCELVSTRCRLR